MPESTHRPITETVLETHTVIQTAGDADYHKRTVLWVTDKHVSAASRARGPVSISTRVTNSDGEKLGFSSFGSLADDLTN